MPTQLFPSLKTNTLIKGLDASANYNKYKKTNMTMVFRTLLKLIFAFLNRHVWLCV